MLKKSVARVLDRSSTWILKSPQSTILSWFKTRLDKNSESVGNEVRPVVVGARDIKG